MPPDMHTTVSIAVSSYYVAPGKGSLWNFVGLIGSALALCLFIFLYAVMKTTHRPRRTGYPTLDFAINCLGSQKDGTVGHALVSLKARDEIDIKDELRNLQVVCQ